MVSQNSKILLDQSNIMTERKHHSLNYQKYKTFTEMTCETRLPIIYMTSNELFSSFYNLYAHLHTVSQCVGTKKKIKEFSFIFNHWHILRSTLYFLFTLFPSQSHNTALGLCCLMQHNYIGWDCLYPSPCSPDRSVIQCVSSSQQAEMKDMLQAIQVLGRTHYVHFS